MCHDYILAQDQLRRYSVAFVGTRKVLFTYYDRLNTYRAKRVGREALVLTKHVCSACRFQSRRAVGAHIWWPSSRGHLPSSRGVLQTMVYPVPAIAGCDCSWLFWLTSEIQVASCSTGLHMSIAERGLIVPVRWTHSAVASPTAAMSRRGPWLRINSALYSEFSASTGANPKGVPPPRPHRDDRLAVGEHGPVADGPVLHAAVASDALGPPGRPRTGSHIPSRSF